MEGRLNDARYFKSIKRTNADPQKPSPPKTLQKISFSKSSKTLSFAMDEIHLPLREKEPDPSSAEKSKPTDKQTDKQMDKDKTIGDKQQSKSKSL